MDFSSVDSQISVLTEIKESGRKEKEEISEFELIVKSWEELKTNPEQLKDLDRKSVTELLRRAVTYEHLFEKCPEIIQLIVDFNADVKPLDLALLRGNLQLVESQLKDGAPIDGPEWENFSPAQYVFYLKDSELRRDMLLLLMKYGLDTNFINKQGESLIQLLIESLRTHDIDAVELRKILMDSRIPKKPLFAYDY